MLYYLRVFKGCGQLLSYVTFLPFLDSRSIRRKLGVVIHSDLNIAWSRMITHVLFESASGYAIFEAKLAENIALKTSAMQNSIRDLGKFGKMVSLLSFTPFKSAAQALENINDVSEGAQNLILI